MADKKIIMSVNDITLPEEDGVTFDEFNQADDRERWRGRLSLLELPEGGGNGAGGNADASGDDPIVSYHSGRDKGKITGPQSGIGKGNSK